MPSSRFHSDFWIADSDQGNKVWLPYDPDSCPPRPILKKKEIVFESNPYYDDSYNCYPPTVTPTNQGVSNTGGTLLIVGRGLDLTDSDLLQTKYLSSDTQLFYDGWRDVLYTGFIQDFSPPYIPGTLTATYTILFKVF